jgi:hypothetical protein
MEVCHVRRCILLLSLSSYTVRTSRYIPSFSRPTPVSLFFMLGVVFYFCKWTFILRSTIITHMADMDIRVTSVIQAYQRRLNSKLYVPSTTFGFATQGANANARMDTDGDVGGWNLLPQALLPRQSGTVHAFGRVISISWRFCSSHTTSFAALLLILSNKNTFVQSPPTTCKICDITYYIATNPLRRRRRPSYHTPGDIIAKEWVLFIHSCWQSCW